jgi:hypothetical protein
LIVFTARWRNDETRGFRFRHISTKIFSTFFVRCNYDESGVIETKSCSNIAAKKNLSRNISTYPGNTTLTEGSLKKLIENFFRKSLKLLLRLLQIWPLIQKEVG